MYDGVISSCLRILNLGIFQKHGKEGGGKHKFLHLFEKVKSKAQFPLELQHFYFLQVFIQINQKKIKNDTVE